MLEELIERVEALTGVATGREVEECIRLSPWYETATSLDPLWHEFIQALQGSIDAALAFAERVLPGRMMRVFDNPDDGSSTAQIVTVSGDLHTGNHISWPLAIILATLKAKACTP